MPFGDPSQSADQEAKCSEGRLAAALALHVSRCSKFYCSPSTQTVAVLMRCLAMMSTGLTAVRYVMSTRSMERSHPLRSSGRVRSPRE